MNYDILYILLTLLILPAIIFGFYAQSKVNAAYSKGAKLISQKNIAAKDFARKVLDTADMSDVQVVCVRGHLSDHYDPRTKTVALSEQNYNSASLASLGIAAHEIGHAMQHKTNYKPLKIRNMFIKVSNIVSRALLPLIIISILISAFLFASMNTSWGLNSIGMMPIFIVLGIYGISTILSLVTMFVEFNASKRTEELLVGTSLLSEDEYDEVKKVLKAAALTYVAAFITNLVEFLRILFLLLASRSRND